MRDPGGWFASDEHRRVMAAVPPPGDEPQEAEALLEGRIVSDDFLDLDADELDEILLDLEADGHVKQLKKGWRLTASGFKVLTGPNKED